MKKLGRPKKYDSAIALKAAMRVFWETGFNNTSLDDLVEVTKMNRPSLSAAFGSKKEIYIKAAKMFAFDYGEKIKAAIDNDDIIQSIANVMEIALDTYLFDEDAALGCFIISTSPSETKEEDIKVLIKNLLSQLDDIFINRFEKAKQKGQIIETANPIALGKMVSAFVQSLSLRVRSGNDTQELKAYCQEVTSLIEQFTK